MKIAVCIPCFKVKDAILSVIDSIPSSVERIYVIDDCCPLDTGKFVQENSKDSRVIVLFHSENRGVGGAVMTGYQKVIEDEFDIAIKIDGDGQMNTDYFPEMIYPLENGIADYTKGNRFVNINSFKSMPIVRIIGNIGLSIINKMTSGYWNIMDPTNGFTAIHVDALKKLPFHKIEERYFFESDMLFRLYLARAKVVDVPMQAIYGDEVSNLSVMNTLCTFPLKYLSRLCKRILYTYFLRDFNFGSVNLVVGLLFVTFGFLYGVYHWYQATLGGGGEAASGVVMLAALPIILGYQSLLMFFKTDLELIPTEAFLKKTS